MKLTLQIQLLPDREQADQLQSTMERFNQACSWLAEQAFEMKTANKITLQQHFYYELRERFSLSAQMAAICIRHVSGIYNKDKSILPVFRPNAAMPYDSRILSFKDVDQVSILTLEGRIIVPFVMGKYQRERFSLAKGQCDLVRRKDGRCFLFVTLDVPRVRAYRERQSCCSGSVFVPILWSFRSCRCSRRNQYCLCRQSRLAGSRGIET